MRKYYSLYNIYNPTRLRLGTNYRDIRFYGHLNIDNAIATGKTIEHSKWFDNVYNVIDDELRERASLVSCGLEDTED